jgi:hypothetical protein
MACPLHSREYVGGVPSQVHSSPPLDVGISWAVVADGFPRQDGQAYLVVFDSFSPPSGVHVRCAIGLHIWE